MAAPDFDRRLIWPGLAAEHVSGLGEQLALPVGDLVGVQVMLLRQFGQRLVASNNGERHTRHKNAAECVRRGLLLMLAPVLTGDVLAFRSSLHPHRVVRFCGASSVPARQTSGLRRPFHFVGKIRLPRSMPVGATTPRKGGTTRIRRSTMRETVGIDPMSVRCRTYLHERGGYKPTVEARRLR